MNLAVLLLLDLAVVVVVGRLVFNVVYTTVTNSDSEASPVGTGLRVVFFGPVFLPVYLYRYGTLAAVDDETPASVASLLSLWGGFNASQLVGAVLLPPDPWAQLAALQLGVPAAGVVLYGLVFRTLGVEIPGAELVSL